ncbi:hypothetical protein LTR66_003763 [Elasticomyces elasticus]|nr:hypothetical protein LTR28_004600 [Elasticomyces elasticus]KAK4991411.1 hypothetical protein LTR50_001803 [Elasticomyces elasticus]KAK4996677.1 hypothetical protein LTR66_003763 [Elasticomyces elasticus]
MSNNIYELDAISAAPINPLSTMTTSKQTPKHKSNAAASNADASQRTKVREDAQEVLRLTRPAPQKLRQKKKWWKLGSCFGQGG